MESTVAIIFQKTFVLYISKRLNFNFKVCLGSSMKKKQQSKCTGHGNERTLINFNAVVTFVPKLSLFFLVQRFKKKKKKVKWKEPHQTSKTFSHTNKTQWRYQATFTEGQNDAMVDHDSPGLLHCGFSCKSMRFYWERVLPFTLHCSTVDYHS